MLIFTTVLAPFFSKRTSPEFLFLTSLLSTPLLWASWDLPTVHSLGLLSDKLSVILMFLTLWMSALMLLYSPSDNFLSLNIVLLLWSLLAFFSVSSLLFLFVFFEASLIPTLCLVMGWGYQPERLEASYYFVFYTITMSIPLLVSIIWLVSVSGSKYFYFDTLHTVCGGVVGFLMLCVFLIKLPLFMTHFWLPKAHVEAPVVGSMILAGVLLKTGGYGVMRIFLYMNKTLVSVSFMTLGLIGMVSVCAACLYCTDLKQCIAYSSVSHMNLMVVSLMNNSLTSFSGGMVMMISHGICSSLMFMLADLSYKRCQSRSILLNKGFLSVAPSLALFWGLTMMFNIGVPPTAGSISELLVITAASKGLALFYLMFTLYLFLSAFYSMYLYTAVNHGSAGLTSFGIGTKETFLAMTHVLPLAGLTLIMDLLSL